MQGCVEDEHASNEWCSQKEELIALKSIYSGESELVLQPSQSQFISFDEFLDKKEHPSCVWPLVIRIHLPVCTSTQHDFNISVMFQLDNMYPTVPPLINLKCKHLTETCGSILEQNMTSFAATLQPEPCLFAVLQWLKDSVSNLTVDDISPESFSRTRHTTLCGSNTTEIYSSASLECASNSAANPFKTNTTCSVNEESPTHCRLKPCNTTCTCTMSRPKSPAHMTQEEVTTGQRVCVVKLDHMRSESKYFKVLNSWAKELEICGKILNAGVHSIYVVLVGRSNSLGEYLRRWKTQNVDVDSRGKPCKEKLMRILYQEVLKQHSSGFTKRSNRSCGLALIHCTRGDLLEHLNDEEEVKRMVQKFV